MVSKKQKDRYGIKSEKGSALVLTLLFILLLTTMSTGLYLYATKQTINADTKYTSVAAGYVAEAGLEAAKGIMARMDPILDTAGQNPNGRIEDDDFPVMLPGPIQVGRYQGHEGRQGVGTYTCRIDLATSEMGELEFYLTRNIQALNNLVYPSTSPHANRLLSFKDLKLCLRQDREVINDFEINYLDAYILNGQIPGTSQYQPISFDNVLNPFAGRSYFVELTATRIDFDKDYNDYDHWRNRLVLFPDPNLIPICPDAGNSHIVTDKTGVNALVFSFSPKPEAYYVLHVRNDDISTQPNLTLTLYYSVSGSDTSTVVIPGSSWSSGEIDAYAILDFAHTGYAWRSPLTHPKSPSLTNNFQLVLEVTNTNASLAGYDIWISRGTNDSIDLEYRMRTESMYETCPGGNPASPSCCWYPDWPDCTGSTPFEHIITLDQGDLSTARFGRSDITPAVQILEYENKIKVDKLYTITATGNVEQSSQTHMLFLSPLSYLDYSRFLEGILSIGGNATYSGKVYAQGRIQLPTTPGTPVEFYDDVSTSSILLDPASNAVFHGYAELKTLVPPQYLPDSSLINTFVNLAQTGGWYIPNDAYIFLGNYDYTGRCTTQYGFDFYDPNPGDNDDVAFYIEPTADFLDPAKPEYENRAYRPGWSPTGGIIDLTHFDSNGNRFFNGVIFVAGDLHIWGKLSGRPLTIYVAGNIYIEREVLMGTDVLDSASPHKSLGDGLPVHLGLICGYSTGSDPTDISGNIYLSQYCPRIMRVEAALMAYGGRWMVEDNDYRPASNPSQIDADHSHGFYHKHYDTLNHRWVWIQDASPNPHGTIDINGDGRLSPPFIGSDDPAITELGGWDENTINASDYLWYLTIIGPIITEKTGAPRHYEKRSAPPFSAPGPTRIYRYDPSIKFNPPPYFPVPENALKLLEWSNAVPDLPS